jgi:hypothetical protein
VTKKKMVHLMFSTFLSGGDFGVFRPLIFKMQKFKENHPLFYFYFGLIGGSILFVQINLSYYFSFGQIET